jgi:hypothetical protein
MLIDQISAFVTQDPQEMIWIETQASILVIIAICLLCLWPIAEYYRYYVQVKKGDLVKHGMNYLFSNHDEM